MDGHTGFWLLHYTGDISIISYLFITTIYIKFSILKLNILISDLFTPYPNWRITVSQAQEVLFLVKQIATLAVTLCISRSSEFDELDLARFAMMDCAVSIFKCCGSNCLVCLVSKPPTTFSSWGNGNFRELDFVASVSEKTCSSHPCRLFQTATLRNTWCI